MIGRHTMNKYKLRLIMRTRISEYLDGQNFTDYRILPRRYWNRIKADRTIMLINPKVSDIDSALDTIADDGQLFIFI